MMFWNKTSFPKTRNLPKIFVKSFKNVAADDNDATDDDKNDNHDNDCLKVASLQCERWQKKHAVHIWSQMLSIIMFCKASIKMK